MGPPWPRRTSTPPWKLLRHEPPTKNREMRNWTWSAHRPRWPGSRFTASWRCGTSRHRSKTSSELRRYACGRFWQPWEDGSVETLELARELLDRFARGSVCQRFREIAPNVIGREIPTLLAPEGQDDAVGFVSGLIDLLYQDPETGEHVVVDFKTDRVEGTEDIASRAEAYRTQELVYARAAQEALGLGELPRRELWFLWPDFIHVA